MSLGTIIRVFGVDGLCEGLHYMDLDTGRVLFSDIPLADHCVYRVSLQESTSTIAGSYAAAYFDRFDASGR
jgi:hypothetical protein